MAIPAGCCPVCGRCPRPGDAWGRCPTLLPRASHGQPPPAAPPPRRRAELTDRHARLRRRGRRAARRLRRVRAGRDPRRHGARRRRQVQARLRRGAHDRGAQRQAPTGSQPVADHPGAPWQMLPYERQLEVKQDAGRRRAAADRQARRLRARADRAGGGAVALPQQARVLVRDRRGRRARVRLPRPRPLGRDRRDLRLHAGLRARQRRRARRSSRWCRAQGLGPYDRRTGEGFLRNLVVREGRRTGELQVRLVTSPGQLDRESLAAAAGSADGLLWTRLDSVAETTAGRRTELLAGADRLRRGARRAAAGDLRRGVLSDQHRDGRAAVCAGDRVRAS